MAAAKSKLPPSTTKTGSRVSRPITSTLSAEFVRDSDDSVEEVRVVDRNRGNETRKALKSSKTTSESRKPSSSGLIKSSNQPPAKKRKLTNPTSIKDTPSRNGATKVQISQSTFDHDSQIDPSSEEVSQVIENTPAPPSAKDEKAMNGLATERKVKPSSSKAATIRNSNQSDGKINQTQDVKGKQDESESEEGSDSETLSHTSEESTEEYSSQSNTRPTDISPQPIRPYEPPSGFKSATMSIHPSSKISDILARSSLKGKQIWHITAPASVSLSSVKEVSMHDIQNGSSVLSYKGAEYGFSPQSEEKQSSDYSLLLPHAESNDYRLGETNITSSLHLQRFVKLPEHIHKAPDLQQPQRPKPTTHVKVVRQQPPGLKMRYRPFGVSSGDSDSDSDSDVSTRASPKTAHFHAPKALTVDSSEATRKDVDEDSTNSDLRNARIVQHKKKRQKPLDADRLEINGNGMDMDVPMNEQPPKIPYSSEERRAKSNRLPPNGNLVNGQKIRKREKPPQTQDSKPAAVNPIVPLDVVEEVETIMPEEVVSQDIGVNKISPLGRSKERKDGQKKPRPVKSTENRSDSQPNIERITSPILIEDSSQRDLSMQEGQNKQRSSAHRAPKTETKEERAKQKEEKRKRKAALNSN